MKRPNASEVPLGVCEAVQLTAADLAKLDGCLKRHWKRYRKALKRAQKDSSEEPVHDSRVEARRLLAVTDLLLPLVRGGVVEKIEELLKRHLDFSDQLRDTQVQLLTVERLEEKTPAFRDFAAFLRKREQRLTKKARKRLKAAKTGKLERLVDCCRKDLKKELKKHPAAELCRRLMSSVERAFLRTQKFYAQITPHDTATIHRTRVCFKKFRYMAEALTELLPGVGGEYCCQLREYQGLMGDIQDREVLVENFSRWVLKKPRDGEWALQAQGQLKTGARKLVNAYLAQAEKLLEFWPLPGHPDVARRVTSRGVKRPSGPISQTDGSVSKERRNQ